MNCIKILMTTSLWIGMNVGMHAQVILSSEEAVTTAIENNYGIKLADNNTQLALNNTSKYNTGQLPTVSLDGGYNYRLDNTSVNFQDGRNSELTFAPSQAVNVSVNANYILFDGFMRKYNIQQLKEQYALSLIELEATMENIAAQTLTQYYQIASLSENLKIINASIDISKKRLERTQQYFEYGQGSQLAVLNARVDLNNDSLSYINTEIQLKNAKRLLNNLMVSNGTTDYDIVYETEFISAWSRDNLKADMLKENLEIIQIDKSIEIGNLSIDLANARKLPTIGTNVSYGYSYNKNNSASFLASQNSNGMNAGLTLSWNIFDGGTTRHAEAQARIANEGLALQKEQLIKELEYTFDNAWANYENRLFVYQTQLSNVEINRNNFLRSEEQFNIGQINSLDYRQAQLNLLNAETELNTARFDVKISEVELLLLSGRILN